MGNNPQGLHDLNSCVQYPGSVFQLNVLDVSPPISMLGTYYMQDHLVFVTYEGVESFYNALRVYDYSLERPHSVSSFFLAGIDLYIAEDTGVILKLDSVTLEVKDRIIPSKLLPGRITCLILVNDIMFAGHLAGDITGFSISSHCIVQEFTTSLINPVEILAFSPRYQLLCVSTGSRDEPKVKLISIKKQFNKNLLGIQGKCTGLLIFDEKNLAMSTDSSNRVYLWDIITGNLLLNTLLPGFFQLSMTTCLTKTLLGQFGFAVGYSNNSVAWGNLAYSEDACQYYFIWKGWAKSAADGNILGIQYCSDIFGLVLTCDRGISMFLKNLNKDVRILKEKKPLFSIGDYLGAGEYSTDIKVLRRNLTNKSIPVVSEEMVNKIRERLDGKRGSVEEKSIVVKEIEENKSLDKDILRNNKILEIEEGQGNSEISIKEEIGENKSIIKEEKGEINEEIVIDEVKPRIEELLQNEEKIQFEIKEIESREEKLKNIEIENTIQLRDNIMSNEENEKKNFNNELISIPEAIQTSLKLEESSNEFSAKDAIQVESVINIEKLEEQLINTDLLQVDSSINEKSQEASIIPVLDLQNPSDSVKTVIHEIQLKESPDHLIEDPEKIIKTQESNIIEDKPPEKIELKEEKKEILDQKNSDIVEQSIKTIEVEEEKKNIPIPTQAKKPQTPFQIFLAKKKPELLKETPDATHKQIVMKVTQLWGGLSESEKKEFEMQST